MDGDHFGAAGDWNQDKDRRLVDAVKGIVKIVTDAAIAAKEKAEAEVDRLRADAAILVHAYDHDSRPPQDVVERLRGVATRGVRGDLEPGGGEEGSER